MKRIEVAEVIRRVFEKGIPFEKVDCFLLAEVPELTVSKLARPIAKRQGVTRPRQRSWRTCPHPCLRFGRTEPRKYLLVTAAPLSDAVVTSV